MSSYNIKLIKKEAVAEDTFLYRFAKPPGFDWLPGQSVVLQALPNPKSPENFPRETDSLRDMTIASAPEDKYLDFAMRQSQSAFKQALAVMQPGDEVVIFGPKGRFVFEADSRPMVMLAGGIGMAPFISMLRHLKHNNLPQDVTLIYSSPNLERIAFKNELDELSRTTKFKVIYTLTKDIPVAWPGEQGRINSDMIRKYVPNLAKPVFYICGSSAMVEDTKRIVIDLGVKQENIKKEEFTGY